MEWRSATVPPEPVVPDDWPPHITAFTAEERAALVREGRELYRAARVRAAAKDSAPQRRSIDDKTRVHPPVQRQT